MNHLLSYMRQESGELNIPVHLQSYSFMLVLTFNFKLYEFMSLPPHDKYKTDPVLYTLSCIFLCSVK